MLGLWKYNKTTGYWQCVRMCEIETAEHWLAVWQKDEPNAVFKLSKRTPRLPKM